ncbi:MAG TPA: hypothetical protein PLY87_18810, partial [Planctomycetaceae bacterium]|nr:hypothetical protein [Planctomycetaceae bacterium]
RPVAKTVNAITATFVFHELDIVYSSLREIDHIQPEIVAGFPRHDNSGLKVSLRNETQIWSSMNLLGKKGPVQ